jgi:hypothetical protein
VGNGVRLAHKRWVLWVVKWAKKENMTNVCSALSTKVPFHHPTWLEGARGSVQSLTQGVWQLSYPWGPGQGVCRGVGGGIPWLSHHLPPLLTLPRLRKDQLRHKRKSWIYQVAGPRLLTKEKEIQIHGARNSEENRMRFDLEQWTFPSVHGQSLLTH